MYATPPEATSQATAAPPDVVLLDIRMPDIDGFQVMTELVVRRGPAVLPDQVVADHATEHASDQGAGDLLVPYATPFLAELGSVGCLLEGFVPFTGEVSLIAVRARDGEIRFYPLVHNTHKDGILKLSVASTDHPLQALAEDYSSRVLKQLDYVGVMAVEYFALGEEAIFNEMAPRVHNSGHWTIEGAVTSQFEQHVRAICGLPLGSTARITASAAMDNLIGDDIDQWQRLLAEPGAFLHLYGKGEARPGRKMGHVTRLSG